MKKFMVVLMMLFVVGIFSLDSKKREPRPSVTSYKMADGIFKPFVHDYVNMLVCKSIPDDEPYLGQKPPGMMPEVFAPGIISKGFHELNISISPKGDEIFYVTSDRDYKLYNIIQLKKVNNQWMPPEVAPFSGFHIDNSLCFDADGNRLFFRSKRPPGGTGVNRNDGNFWVVEKTEGGWSPPVMLEGPVNTEKNELALSVAANDTIYFSAVYEPAHGGDIYYSKRKNGKYMLPEKLDWGISTKHGEGRPFISPDENYLLFQSDRPGSLGQNDIYVSFKKHDGSWGEPKNLGTPVNSEASDFAPSVSPDGKYLFFSSYRTMNPKNFQGKTYQELMSLYLDPRNGYATLFWVDAKIIDNARTKMTGK